MILSVSANLASAAGHLHPPALTPARGGPYVVGERPRRDREDESRMPDVLGASVKAPDQALRLSAIYTRIVAILLLCIGLARASMILGIGTGTSFLDLSMGWRSAAVTLLFIDLFAAVGLWIGATWGPVIWAVAMVVEVSMYTIFSDIFGSYPFRVFAHVLLFLVFVALSLIDWRRNLTN